MLIWYDKHGRTLPWRAAKGTRPDPYAVWLSEIMLQQTTVATVGPYFEKVIKRWPTLAALAKADAEDILRQWAGLGYYRRAKMLHLCAQKLQNEFNGVFPEDETTLLTLPGFGPYTAAAVGAIAFGLPTNVVDGNVERVMARLFLVSEPLPKAKAKLKELASTLVPKKRCGDYAQAVMDLGATVCTPRLPKCAICPWQSACLARAKGVQETLPRRVKTKPKPVRRTVAFVLINDRNEVLLRKRPPTGLLAGMLEVPSTDWTDGSKAGEPPIKASWRQISPMIAHVFTHFKLEIDVQAARTTKGAKGLWIPLCALENEAVPSLTKKIVRHALRKL